jgi:hypothetical protein
LLSASDHVSAGRRLRDQILDKAMQLGAINTIFAFQHFV